MPVLTFLGFLWNHGALGVSRVAQAAEVCYSGWGKPSLGTVIRSVGPRTHGLPSARRMCTVAGHMVSMPPALLVPAASDPRWVSWCGQQLRVGLGAGLVEHGLSLAYFPGSFFRGECVNSHLLKKACSLGKGIWGIISSSHGGGVIVQGP